MVFATEFDPIDQSQRHRADQAKRAQSTEQSADLPHQHALKLGHSRLSQSDQTQFLIDQAAPVQPLHSPVHSIEVARPIAFGLARSRRLSTRESLGQISRQPQKNQTGKLAASGISPADKPADKPTNRPTNKPIDKVVPLHLGSPAIRVQANPASELALSFTDKSKLPWRLKLLNQVQQGSTLITGLLFTGALIAYGSTVYVDKSTGRALRQLDTLQSESQQLTSANEAIKQSLAEQAEQAGSGLEPYDPGDALFLSPEPKRALHTANKTPAKMPRPLGY